MFKDVANYYFLQTFFLSHSALPGAKLDFILNFEFCKCQYVSPFAAIFKYILYKRMNQDTRRASCKK